MADRVGFESTNRSLYLRSPSGKQYPHKSKGKTILCGIPLICVRPYLRWSDPGQEVLYGRVLSECSPSPPYGQRSGEAGREAKLAADVSDFPLRRFSCPLKPILGLA